MGIVSQHKIKRLENESHPLFSFRNCVATHKVDGTSSRIMWEPNEEQIYLGSKNRKWPLESDEDNQGFAEWVKSEARDSLDLLRDKFSDVPITVLGEFFKNDILGRVEYGDEGRFRVFDVHINEVYLDWMDVVDVADKLNFEPVPYEILHDFDMEDLDKRREGEDPLALDDADEERKIKEGVVVRPLKEFTYKGDRVLTKYKSEKFEEVKKGTNKGSGGESKESKFDEEEIKKVDKYITESRIHSAVQNLRDKNPGEYQKIDRRVTGDVISEVVQDIREEATDELDDQVLGKYGGSEIASKLHSMIEQAKFEEKALV
jgi:hypothetical protein